MSARTAPEVHEVHQACIHEFDSTLPYLEVKKVSTDIQLQDETYLHVVLHPRWCQDCIKFRQKAIHALGMQKMTGWESPLAVKADPVAAHAVGKGKGKGKVGKQFPQLEEKAYNLGLMKGRQRGVEMNFEMGPESARVALLCGPTAGEVQTLLQSLLTEPKINDMVRDFDAWCKIEKNPDFAWYIGQLDKSMKDVGLDPQQQDLVRRMVQRYRDGQLKGLYFTWMTEARALGEADPMVRNRIFEEAIMVGVPRDHRDWVWN